MKLGRSAVPALKKASGSTDPEIGRRAEALIFRIEAGEVLNATRFTLDLHARPLAEAADELFEHSGMKIKPGSSTQIVRSIRPGPKSA